MSDQTEKVEITPEMLEAGDEQFEFDDLQHYFVKSARKRLLRKIFEAMILADPRWSAIGADIASGNDKFTGG